VIFLAKAKIYMLHLMCLSDQDAPTIKLGSDKKYGCVAPCSPQTPYSQSSK